MQAFTKALNKNVSEVEQDEVIYENVRRELCLDRLSVNINL